MDGSSFFKALGIVYGALLILRLPAMRLLRSGEHRSENESADTVKQPVWVWPVGALGILLIVFTWYMHARYPVSYSWVATLAVTLTVFKGIQVLFSGRRFRDLISRVLVRDRTAFTRMDVTVLAVGLILILMGIWVY
jgi:hypothetical protein